jgi:hypothetical protein
VNRDQLEHVIREVGRRTGLEYFYIIGSSAILATLPKPIDAVLYKSRDVDVIPAPKDISKTEALADQLDWVLGEGSDFEIEHGYYVQGVTQTTPTYAPHGWEARALPIRVDRYTGLCMEAHDLALSKYGAGREKICCSPERWLKPEYSTRPYCCNVCKMLKPKTSYVP